MNSIFIPSPNGEYSKQLSLANLIEFPWYFSRVFYFILLFFTCRDALKEMKSKEMIFSEQKVTIQCQVDDLNAQFASLRKDLDAKTEELEVCYHPVFNIVTSEYLLVLTTDLTVCSNPAHLSV